MNSSNEASWQRGRRGRILCSLEREGWMTPDPPASYFCFCKNEWNLLSFQAHYRSSRCRHLIDLVVAIRNHRSRALELKFKFRLFQPSSSTSMPYRPGSFKEIPYRSLGFQFWIWFFEISDLFWAIRDFLDFNIELWMTWRILAHKTRVQELVWDLISVMFVRSVNEFWKVPISKLRNLPIRVSISYPEVS